ncbi:ABC transporter permease subunit [Pelagibacteraceae bacterium]|nr:ABC transporter permease subunit [Candidatus Pelagibacter sp.]MDC1485315.1 ABC transporter permease subunit [Pelagibacteraceae bacterium]
MEIIKKYPKTIQWIFLLLVFFSLCFAIEIPEGYEFAKAGTEFIDKDKLDQTKYSVFWRLPSFIAWMPGWLNDSVYFLLNEWLPIEYFDTSIQETKTRPLVLHITRLISSSMLFLIQFIREILIGGVDTIVAFTSWDFISANPWAKLPGLPWTIVAGFAILLAHKLSGRNLAIFAAITMIYISAFGQWKPSMQTLSFVLVAAPISFILGLGFGIWAYKSKKVEKILNPLLNVAQTMPHYSYLVPIMVLFGIGDHAGAIATIIFATPPMVRLTLLGLRKVSPEVIEAGKMSGCTDYQLLFEVLIPTARRDILIGVNQVIMQCLAMAVIASFIGAKGLGWNLLLALNQLRIGLALEAGICITLIAVLLDKLSLAWANKQKNYFENPTPFQKNKYLYIFSGVFVVGYIFSFLGTFFFREGFNYFFIVPHNKGISTEAFWNAGVDWILVNFFDTLKIFNTWLIVDILIPMKNAFLRMPIVATFVLFMGTGYIIGGIRSALVVGSFTLFIAMTEWWDRALITMYMATFGVIVSGIFGIILGTLSAQTRTSSRITIGVCDTLQTFPSFVYLIPVIMLFGVTDTSVLIAVVVYATIPATRYTIEGLRSVPTALHDAGSMSGVTRLQRWLKIELPLAFPHMMLGINQTVVFALFMVIIGAMIGTTDLGQYILKALSDRQGIGNGLMLGLCVAFIGLAVDNLIRTWAEQQKKLLGQD